MENEMKEFLEKLESLVNRYNIKIETLCDNVVGTPHAVVRKRGTESYFNVDMETDNGYNWGDPISY